MVGGMRCWNGASRGREKGQEGVNDDREAVDV